MTNLCSVLTYTRLVFIPDFDSNDCLNYNKMRKLQHKSRTHFAITNVAMSETLGFISLNAGVSNPGKTPNDILRSNCAKGWRPISESKLPWNSNDQQNHRFTVELKVKVKIYIQKNILVFALRNEDFAIRCKTNSPTLLAFISSQIGFWNKINLKVSIENEWKDKEIKSHKIGLTLVFGLLVRLELA